MEKVHKYLKTETPTMATILMENLMDKEPTLGQIFPVIKGNSKTAQEMAMEFG